MARKGTAIRTKIYNRFKGVDFSTDPALVDDSRSPLAVNMIADRGGMPERRPGWIELKNISAHLDGARVNGLYDLGYNETNGARFLIHYGNTLQAIYEDGSVGRSSATVNDEKSVGVVLKGDTYVFTGAEIIRASSRDGYFYNLANTGYVPRTVIARDPAGGGTQYEAVNLITSHQSVSFIADGTSTVYHLPYTDLNGIDKILINGERLDAGWVGHLIDGTVVFDTAPPAPTAGAEDNVEIYFSKIFPGYTDRIAKCRIAFVWGANGASDRIIASGNPDYPNYDFTCAFEDATYWPDTGYAVIGSEKSAIVGYRRIGSDLAIIKEDIGTDSTVFIRSSYINDDGEAIFPVKPTLSGVGAVTRFGFGNIGDEQLFLTGDGIYAITTNNLTAERIAQNRSMRIDAKLLRESLADAICVSWDSKLLLGIDGKVYGLDGRQARAYVGRNDTNFLYECFYLENVPARCWAKHVEDGVETLYFGTNDGRICRVKSADDTLNRFSDEYLENGEMTAHAIPAIWATRSDDDGDPMIYKTMLKKGNAVTIKPYMRSSAKILFRTDRDAVGWQAAEGTMDIFDWEDIDFSRFTFNANDAPQEIPFRRKVKNYKRLQIIIKNDAVNEGFGVFQITRHFVAGNFTKR